MERRYFGPFSGTHLTVMVCTALLVPGALYAAVNYTNVAISDLNLGTTATVDVQNRLRVYDFVAGYTKNPNRVVNIVDNTDGSTGIHTIYTVPT